MVLTTIERSDSDSMLTLFLFKVINALVLMVREKKTKERAKNMIYQGTKIKLHEVFDNVYLLLDDSLEEIFNKKMFYDSSSLPSYLSVDEDIFFQLKVLSKRTLTYLNDLANKNNFSDYNFVEVTRSSKPKIVSGTYIYKFDKLDNFWLLRVPFKWIEVTGVRNIGTEKAKSVGKATVAMVDFELVQDPVLIKKEDLKDFQVFGTELMQTSTSISGSSPGVKTIFSELVLGPSYAILQGLSKVAINSMHTVEDTRVVQVILCDKTDIELRGISIYYEFNRRLGNIKNKEADEPTKVSNQKNYIEELRELKELMDEGIITEEEFKRKKEAILGSDLGKYAT